MAKFQHTRDNLIEVDGLWMTLAFFLTQEPDYKLPATDLYGTTINCTSQVYDQGIKHILKDDTIPTQYTGVYPWTDGDTYISKKLTYQDALYPPQTLSAAKDQKLAELDRYAAQYYAGGVTINAVTYMSSYSYLTNIQNQFEYFDAIETSEELLPVGYYTYDINYNRITLTHILDLGAIIQLILEMHYQVQLVFNDHQDAIKSLITINAVEKYDFTTGWPTVPYVSGS